MIDWFVRTFGAGAGEGVTPIGAALVFVLGSAAVLMVVSGGLSAGAVALRHGRNRHAEVRGERAARWKEALHGILYGNGEPATLWRLVGEDGAFDFLDFLVQYARRLEGDERRVISSLAQPYLERMAPFLSRRSDTRRARAVQMLGELGLPEHAPMLIAALSDRSPMVAMVAASALARADTPEYAAEVLDHLHRFQHWRQDFLVAMVASMGEDAAPALRRMLMDPAADGRVRSVAADALAILSDPKAADPAADILEATPDLELKASALRVLASVGRQSHLAPVRASVDSGHLAVRLAAIRALGRFGTAEDLPMLEAAVKHDPSPWVAIAAARALKGGGGGRVLEALAGSEHPRAALGLQVISEARSW